MNDCKYLRCEVVDGIKHEFCCNEEMKKVNKSKEKDIPCIKVLNCKMFEPLSNTEKEVTL